MHPIESAEFEERSLFRCVREQAFSAGAVFVAVVGALCLLGGVWSFTWAGGAPNLLGALNLLLGAWLSHRWLRAAGWLPFQISDSLASPGRVVIIGLARSDEFLAERDVAIVRWANANHAVVRFIGADGTVRDLTLDGYGALTLDEMWSARAPSAPAPQSADR